MRECHGHGLAAAVLCVTVPPAAAPVLAPAGREGGPHTRARGHACMPACACAQPLACLENAAPEVGLDDGVDRGHGHGAAVQLHGQRAVHGRRALQAHAEQSRQQRVRPCRAVPRPHSAMCAQPSPECTQRTSSSRACRAGCCAGRHGTHAQAARCLGAARPRLRCSAARSHTSGLGTHSSATQPTASKLHCRSPLLSTSSAAGLGQWHRGNALARKCTAPPGRCCTSAPLRHDCQPALHWHAPAAPHVSATVRCSCLLLCCTPRACHPRMQSRCGAGMAGISMSGNGNVQE